MTVPALGNTPAAPMNPADTRVDEFADYPRDQWDRPLIAIPGPDGRPVPNPITGQLDRHGTPILWVSEAHVRASTGGSALEHEGGINSWKIRQAVIGFILRSDLFSLAQAVENPGADGRSELDDLVKKAQDAAGSGAAANRGTAGHAFAEKHDRGQKLPALGSEFAPWMTAYITLTEGWRWSQIEARLVCTALRMAGRTDRIGSPPGYMIAPDGQIIGPDDLVVVDLKTSSSSKYFGVKFAVQLAVYAWGDLYDPATGLFTSTGARRDWALVLHIPSGASSGSWWWVNVAAGYELAQLANEVLTARKRKDIVAQVGQVYGTLDEALAAGGVLLDSNYAAPSMLVTGAAAGAWSPEPDGIDTRDECEIHGEHDGTVDCPDCLEVWKAARAVPGVDLEEFDSWRARQLKSADPAVAIGPDGRAVTRSEMHTLVGTAPDGAPTGLAAFGTYGPADAERTRPEPSDPTTWDTAIGHRLQAAHRARQDPEAQRQREILAVASAPPRGGLEAVRQRFALSWSPEHEAAAERRGWELGVLAALERAQDVAGLLAVHAQVSAWSAWSDEFDHVANRRAAEMSRGEG